MVPIARDCSRGKFVSIIIKKEEGDERIKEW
jgi:hypothetical protein